MEGLEIRRATLEDKQAVMDINDNVYDGMDYLKALYEDEFIKSPNTKSYVAVYDNKIVGFAAGTVVDDGLTVISRAARINKEYSNKGFYKMLKNHVSSNSGASLDAFTTADTNPAIQSSSFQQQNRLVYTVIFDMFSLSPNDVRLQTNGSFVSPIKLQNLTQPLLREYFETDNLRKYLFPKERIIVGWVAFRTIPSNIPLFWTRSEHCHRVTDIRREGDVIRGLMSMVTSWIGVNGDLVAAFEIYGSDRESLKGHIISHFDFLSTRNETGIGLCVNAQVELGYDNIEKTFGEFGLTKILINTFDSPSYMTAVSIFEKDLTGKVQ